MVQSLRGKKQTETYTCVTLIIKKILFCRRLAINIEIVTECINQLNTFMKFMAFSSVSARVLCSSCLQCIIVTLTFNSKSFLTIRTRQVHAIYSSINDSLLGHFIAHSYNNMPKQRVTISYLISIAHALSRQTRKIGQSLAGLRVHWPNTVPYMGIHWANFPGLSGYNFSL